MNTDEIVIELGLVSKKTFGTWGELCEGVTVIIPAIESDPDSFDC